MHQAELSLGAAPDPAAQGWSGDEGSPPRPRPTTLAQLCGLTGVWPLPPPGTKAACPGRERGRGTAPRPVPILLPSPHCGSGSPGRGRGCPRLGCGRGLDPSQRSLAAIPPGAFRGVGRGPGDSQAVRVEAASSSFPKHPGRQSAPRPPAALGALPSPSPAWPPQTATTVQNQIKIKR